MRDAKSTSEERPSEERPTADRPASRCHDAPTDTSVVRVATPVPVPLPVAPSDGCARRSAAASGPRRVMRWRLPGTPPPMTSDEAPRVVGVPPCAMPVPLLAARGWIGRARVCAPTEAAKPAPSERMAGDEETPSGPAPVTAPLRPIGRDATRITPNGVDSDLACPSTRCVTRPESGAPLGPSEANRRAMSRPKPAAPNTPGERSPTSKSRCARPLAAALRPRLARSDEFPAVEVDRDAVEVALAGEPETDPARPAAAILAAAPPDAPDAFERDTICALDATEASRAASACAPADHAGDRRPTPDGPPSSPPRSRGAREGTSAGLRPEAVSRVERAAEGDHPPTVGVRAPAMPSSSDRRAAARRAGVPFERAAATWASELRIAPAPRTARAKAAGDIERSAFVPPTSDDAPVTRRIVGALVPLPAGLLATLAEAMLLGDALAVRWLTVERGAGREACPLLAGPPAWDELVPRGEESLPVTTPGPVLTPDPVVTLALREIELLAGTSARRTRCRPPRGPTGRPPVTARAARSADGEPPSGNVKRPIEVGNAGGAPIRPWSWAPSP